MYNNQQGFNQGFNGFNQQGFGSGQAGGFNAYAQGFNQGFASPQGFNGFNQQGFGSGQAGGFNGYAQGGYNQGFGQNQGNRANFSNNPYINQPFSGFGANAQNNSMLGSFTNLFSNMNTSDLIKGAAIGAGLAYVLSNEQTQKSIFKAIAQISQFAVGGVQELKERFEDVQAELDAQKS